MSFSPSATTISLPQSSREDQLKLRLHMETQDLQIKRLQLELFNELSMAEFSPGYTIIIQCCTDVSRRAALISHFHNLMVLEST